MQSFGLAEIPTFSYIAVNWCVPPAPPPLRPPRPCRRQLQPAVLLRHQKNLALSLWISRCPSLVYICYRNPAHISSKEEPPPAPPLNYLTAPRATARPRLHTAAPAPRSAPLTPSCSAATSATRWLIWVPWRPPRWSSCVWACRIACRHCLIGPLLGTTLNTLNPFTNQASSVLQRLVDPRFSRPRRRVPGACCGLCRR